MPQHPEKEPISFGWRFRLGAWLVVVALWLHAIALIVDAMTPLILHFAR